MIRFTIPLKVNAEYGLNKVYAGVHWSKRKKQAEESEINNYQQFENMQFLKPHELGGQRERN